MSPSIPGDGKKPASDCGDKILNDVMPARIRAMDHIKRLYAVTMAFSITTLAGNLFLIDRSVDPRGWDTRFTLIAIFICFILTLSLFYLGSEQMLDRKYLWNPERDPTPLELGFDLFVMGVHAIIFVIIANGFQVWTIGNNKISAHEIDNYLTWFKDALTFLYIFDIATLFIYSIQKFWNLNNNLSSIYPNYIWIGINIFIVITINYYPYEISARDPVYNLNLFAIFLLFAHIVRFILDFWLTFSSYYPLNTSK